MVRQRDPQPYKTSSQYKDPDGGSKLLFALICFGIVVLLVAIIFFYSISPEGIDEETLCPESGPTGVTAMLIDISDKPDNTQKARFESELEKNK